jgi:hypothetical protein
METALTELDTAFQRLLFDAAFRERYLEDPTACGLSAETVSALATIDATDLGRLTRTIRRGVASGNLGGAGIVGNFPATLQLLAGNGKTQDDILDEFLASEQLRGINAVGNVRGICAAEAFHDFVTATATGEPELTAVQHEFCVAILRLMTMTARPYFRVGSPLIRRLPTGWVAILDRNRRLHQPDDEPDEPVLIVAAGDKLWKGPVSKPIASTVAAQARPAPAWSLAAEVPQSAAILATLRARGLL